MSVLSGGAAPHPTTPEDTMSKIQNPALSADIAAATAVALARLIAGMVIDARPWVDGVEQAKAERGIILGRISDDYLLVWFPGRGEPVNSDFRSDAVQGVMVAKALFGGNARPITDEPRTWITTAYRLARKANRTGAWQWLGAGASIERAAKAVRSA